MSRTCGLCGKPAEGWAFIGDVRYCHGDGPGPTCYQRATWDDARAPTPTSRRLTPVEWETLDFIGEFIRAKRYSPTLDEIARHFGLSSVASVHRRVKNLERKGYITRDFNRSRSIDVVDPPPTGRAKHCSGCRCEERIVAEVAEAMEGR